MMARDAGSLAHFPMVCGVIAYAVAVSEAVAHPDAPLSLESRVALGTGLALFLGGMAIALWRSTGRIPVPRVFLILATGVALSVVGGVSPWVTFAFALVGVGLVCVLEERHLPGALLP